MFLFIEIITVKKFSVSYLMSRTDFIELISLVNLERFDWLQCNDYKTAYEACSQQMAAGYCEAWKECRALAEATDYTDVHAK